MSDLISNHIDTLQCRLSDTHISQASSYTLLAHRAKRGAVTSRRIVSSSYLVLIRNHTQQGTLLLPKVSSDLDVDIHATLK